MKFRRPRSIQDWYYLVGLFVLLGSAAGIVSRLADGGERAVKHYIAVVARDSVNCGGSR